MRAAIYSRYSTDKQSEASIADQVRVCAERAAKDGWTVVAHFEDQGISGAALGNRPGVQQMIAVGMARQFDVLLVMELSRLSRSQADLPKIIDRLMARGVRVIGVQDGYDSSRKGHKMQAGLSGIIGEAFREMVSEKTFTALETRAKNGKGTGGRAYGLTSQHEVVPEEAAVVREMFTRYGSGESQNSIARDLNVRRILSPRGRAWVVAAIHAILHNEKYIGKLIWNKSAWRKDPDSGKRIAIDRPAAEWVVVDRPDMRIVDDVTWNRVRARDTPATYGSKQARPKYPLSGLLVCGECGSAMTLAGGANSRGYGERRYVCSAHRAHGDTAHGCGNRLGVSRVLAEELLIHPLRAQLLTDEKFLATLQEIRNHWALTERGFGKNSGASTPRDSGTPIREATPSESAADPIRLNQKIGAIEAAVAAGAMSATDGQAHIARLRAESKRAASIQVESTDESATAAALQRVQAALGGAADVLRDALRREIGLIRCVPERGALVAYADEAHSEIWHLLGKRLEAANDQEGRTALVAGAGFEPATFGL